MTLKNLVDPPLHDSHVWLGLLEQRLGLYRPRLTHSERILAYAGAIDRAGAPGCRASFDADRWATAERMLERREALLLAGWNGSKSRGPQYLEDLGLIEQSLISLLPEGLQTIGDRLRAVLSALKDGLKPNSPGLNLYSSPDDWPPLWRELFGHFSVKQKTPAGGAAKGCGLASCQNLFGGRKVSVKTDESLVLLNSRSRHAAIQGIISWLAGKHRPKDLEEITVVCPDPLMAAELNAGLKSRGLPACGGPAAGATQSVGQILPLMVALCWEPVDAALLMELLSLPVSPVPSKIRRDLALALTAQPGLGSKAWEEAVQAHIRPENDPDGKNKERLEWIFGHCRVRMGQSLPCEFLAGHLQKISQWAAARSRLDTEEAKDADLRLALESLAGQATLLGRLVKEGARAISQPQAARLLAEITGQGGWNNEEQAGAVQLVAELSALPEHIGTVIWLNRSAGSAPHSPFMAAEIEGLRASGLEVDDGEKVARRRICEEMAGIQRIVEQLIIVSVPDEEDARPHILLEELHSALSPSTAIPSLEDLISGRVVLKDMAISGQSIEVRLPPPPLMEWKLPKEIPADRDQHSYSELDQKLSCPLQWSMNYIARLKDGFLASIPDEGTLSGTFAHSVLESVFGKGPGIPTPDRAAELARTVFEDRLEKDASPLALPGKSARTNHLKTAILNSARLLAQALRSAGCNSVEMEAEVEATVDGLKLKGYVDCIGRGPGGITFIIDIKRGGYAYRKESLVAGKAFQLATYAKLSGAKDPGVGFCILLPKNHLLIAEESAPAGCDRITGAEVVEGSISALKTWKIFHKFLKENDDWFTPSGKVPVRPLQPAESWSEGARMVLDENKEEQFTCVYCSCRALCGKEERT